MEIKNAWRKLWERFNMYIPPNAWRIMTPIAVQMPKIPKNKLRKKNKGVKNPAVVGSVNVTIEAAENPAKIELMIIRAMCFFNLLKRFNYTMFIPDLQI